MQTSGLDHIIMTVSDIPRAREFYGGLLGFDLKDISEGFYFSSGHVAFRDPDNIQLEYWLPKKED